MKAVLFIGVMLFGIGLWAQDGSPDLSFGDNGIVETDLGDGEEVFYAAAENSLGHILVVGAFYPYTGEPEKFIASYLENGMLDISFGDNGMIRSTIIDNASYTDIKIQSSDKILIKSSGYNIPTILTQFFPDGSVDTTFGINGSIDLFDSNFYSGRLEVAESGKIMAVTLGWVSDEYQILMKRFLPDGTPDPSFGNNGELIYPISEPSSVSLGDVEMLTDEGFFILYRISQNNTQTFMLLRFSPSGSLDEGFGDNGLQLIPIEDIYTFCSCLAFPDESILVSCNYSDFDFNEFKKMIKLKPEGDLDQSFGNGAVEGLIGSIIQENQRVIVDNSFTDWEGGTDPYYRRIFSDGNLDVSFVLHSNSGTLGSYNLQTLLDGNLLLTGSSIWYNPERYIVLQKFINSPLGIEENTLNNVLISPNPSEGVFNIRMSPLADTVSEYQIVDISGKLIQEGAFESQNFSIDLSAYASGMYFLNLANQTYKLLKN